MTHFSHTLRSAVLRLSDARQRTLCKVRVRLSSGTQPVARTKPPPPQITARLESAFEALAELALQPHVAAAIELVCDTLQAELPAEAVAAGVYDIDADEIRFLAARGVGHDLLRGTALPRARCLAGAEHPVVVDGGTPSCDWIGSGCAGSRALLCPVLHDGTLYGLLALADPLCAADFEDHDLELVRYVAEQLAAFIHAQRHRTSSAAPPPARCG